MEVGFQNQHAAWTLLPLPSAWAHPKGLGAFSASPPLLPFPAPLLMPCAAGCVLTCAQAPPDLIRTVVHGTLLFDSTSTDQELGLTYRPIQEAFQEAVALIKASSNPSAKVSTL